MILLRLHQNISKGKFELFRHVPIKLYTGTRQFHIWTHMVGPYNIEVIGVLVGCLPSCPAMYGYFFFNKKNMQGRCIFFIII